MKHAREDYNRIQDPAGLIPDDEPVFLLRAQDRLACMAVEYYAYLCRKFQAPEVAAKAQEHAELMAAWPKKKIPDLPSEEPDKYGNRESDERQRFCSFPDCGCDGARLCIAESGASNAAVSVNQERGRKPAEEPKLCR